MADLANSPLALDINWGGTGYAAYDGFAFASPAVTPASPADGGSSPPPADGAGSPPAGAPPAGSPPATGNEANIKQLREGYEASKRELENWSKLGKVEDVAKAHTAYTAIHTKYAGIAKQLGYADDDFAGAFAKDPEKTMAVLQQDLAKAQRDGRVRPEDPASQFKKMLDERLKPFEQQRREAEAKEANQKFDTEFERLFTAEKDFQGAPEDLQNLLYDATSEMLKYDDKALAGLKSGDLALVQKYFNDAKTVITKAFIAWQGWQQGKGVQPPAPGGGKPPAKLTLDNIINADENAVSALPSMRR